jgi:AcrR family transcriptional regulator
MPRPSERLLDRSGIARAALALVDEKGDFTMPELAAGLRVRPSSLYHHVQGKAEIVELLRAEVVKGLDHTVLDAEPWDEGLARWARAYRDLFAEHPKAIRMLATAPVRMPEVVDVYEKAVAALLRAGFRDRDVLAVIVAVENFLLGSALDLVMPEGMIEVDEERHPGLSRCLAALPTDVRRADQAFEVGLESLITGFRARLEPSQA